MTRQPATTLQSIYVQQRGHQ